MPNAFKKGDTVKLSTFVPEGPVQAVRMDENGTVQYLVEWTDTSGEIQHRWFDEDALIAA